MREHRHAANRIRQFEFDRIICSMAERSFNRRLAAILAADVVGYSALMRAKEEATLAAVRSDIDQVFAPCIAAHGGRIFKTTGDGLLVEFASVVDAVRCAILVQHDMAARNAGRDEADRILFRNNGNDETHARRHCLGCADEHQWLERTGTYYRY